MKKPHCFIYLLCILFFSIANGQTNKDYIGIKAGISIPNLSANGSDQNPINTGYSSIVGPDFAIFYEKGISKVFSIVPTLEYSSQGGKKDGLQAFVNPFGTTPPYLYADYNSEVKMNYLMLAALAKFSWPLGSKSHYSIYADAGPFGGLLLSAHQTIDGSSVIYGDPDMQTQVFPEQSFNNTQDIKSDLHKGNFGV
ncbi:MAG TPA: outer membrane beta-barrel protein, partial [Chitinophagaceae bacterium]